MRYLIAVLAVAGLVISAMALRIHNTDPAAAPPCSVSEHWDCGTVNHSRYSWFPPKTIDEVFDPKPGAIHLPVAAIGIAGYALIAIVALTGRMWIVLWLSCGGFLCAAYLSYIEEFVIQKWCIYCVWSQATITTILLASIVAILLRRRRRTSSTAPVLADQVD